MKYGQNAGDPSAAHGADLSVLEHRIERLKSSMHLAVIFGGDKAAPGSVLYQSHNTRSWKSYEAVANDIAASLRRLGFRHVEVFPEDMRLGERLRQRGIHMAWLNTGGVQGHNPVTHAPSLLEMMGLPYVGHDPLAATLLDNKHAFKRAAMCAGLATPRFVVSHQIHDSAADFDRKFERGFQGYAGPFVVKPVSGRASLHVHVVDNAADVRRVADEVYGVTRNAVLIEQFLGGREVCVAVSGSIIAPNGRLTRGSGPTPFSAMERVLMPDEQIFTSMDKRPITSDRSRRIDPAQDQKLLDDMARLARQTYLEFDLGSVIRLDLRADNEGELYILEANPKPDLKKPSASVTSLISGGLAEIGLDYDGLIFSLLADRLDFLFERRADTVRHLLDLAETRTLFDFMAQANRKSESKSTSGHQPSVPEFVDAVADMNVAAMNASLKAAYPRARVEPAAGLQVDQRKADAA